MPDGVVLKSLECCLLFTRSGHSEYKFLPVAPTPPPGGATGQTLSLGMTSQLSTERTSEDGEDQ